MPGTSTSGRRPMPTRCLELSGSRRIKKRKSEPTITAIQEIIPPPDYTEKEKEIFGYYSKVLIGMQVLGPGDLATLDIFCRLYASMQELQQFIKVNGRTYDSEAGLKKIRPEVSILSDHTKDFRGFVNLLGLAPSSRVGAKIVDSENDEIESIT